MTVGVAMKGPGEEIENGEIQDGLVIFTVQ